MKDAAAFIKALDGTGNVADEHPLAPGFVSVEGADGFDNPIATKDGDTTLEDLIAAHLVDGQVAVLISVHADRMREMGARAVAVRSTGESVTISTDDIYSLAARSFDVQEDAIATATYRDLPAEARTGGAAIE